MFTLEEALRLLPAVRRLVEEVQTARVDVMERSAALEQLLSRTGGNGHLVGQVEQARQAVQMAMAEMKRLMEELEDMGVELKSIDEGLIDFRSLRDGRVVYLCWRQGEETIEYWHELNAGFAGRQPL